MKDSIENPLIGWDRCWPVFREAFSDLHIAYPEFLAVTRYLAGVVGSGHRRRVPGKSTVAYRRHPRPKRKRGSGAVLFLPLFARAYCLDTTLALAAHLRNAQRTSQIYLLDPPGNTKSLPESIIPLDWRALRRRIPRADFAKEVTRQWREAVAKIEQHEDLSKAMTRKFGAWRRHLLFWIFRYQWEISAARYWLDQLTINAVVTINDSIKPGAAFVAAALRSGIPTVLLQHGTPGPMSVPFMARECWVWGETSLRSFEHFGADVSRLRVIGNLETEKDGITPKRKECGEHGPFNLLLMLQWRGSDGWHEPFYRDVVDLTGAAVAAAAAPWRLTLRMHPLDGDDIIGRIRQRLDCLGISYAVAPRHHSVEEDTDGADAVTTINSASVMHAVHRRIPCCQFLPERVEGRLGPALLQLEDVVRDQIELTRWLNSVAAGREASPSGPVLANSGQVMHCATERLVQLCR